jgi:predicted  nucleic acid-binding Zn-ribbon protein
MAAGDYMKTAASNLRQAAVHLRQQSKDMQTSLVRVRADKKTLINNDSSQMKAVQVEAGVVQDAGRRSRLAQQMDKLQKEIMSALKELEQTEKELINAANAKIDAAIGIENQAKQLEDQAARID